MCANNFAPVAQEFMEISIGKKLLEHMVGGWLQTLMLLQGPWGQLLVVSLLAKQPAYVNGGSTE